MRRTGKSYFLRALISDLQNRESAQILYINKESVEFDWIHDYKDLYQHVTKQFRASYAPKYLFIDEIQEIENWEKAIASFLAEDLADIFITGSNAHLLSSELATLISGRYIEFPIFSLGLQEFLIFKGSSATDADKEFP